MPKQTLVSNKGNKIVDCSELDYGELGEIITPKHYAGCIITVMYEGYILVYSPDKNIVAFLTCWVKDFSAQVRLLSPKEKVILEND